MNDVTSHPWGFRPDITCLIVLSFPAASIAWINSIGNLGGFFGPWWIGYMRDLTGSFAGGLYGLALLSFISAVVCALFLHIPDVVTPGKGEPAMAPVR